MRVRQPEKVVQVHIVNLFRSIGGRPFVLGTRRPRGDFHGTCQTPGIPHVWAFLPSPPLRPGATPSAVWVEVKAAGGKLRPEQIEFKAFCESAGVAHVVGGLDDLIAFLIHGGWLSREHVPHYRLPQTGD